METAKRKAKESSSAVADVAKKASGPVSKAKGPVVAGAAAAAGMAAGAALARNGSSRRFGLGKPRMTKVLATTAKEVGKAGYKAGELTAEMRKVREQMK
jgi:hypothetical protein